MSKFFICSVQLRIGSTSVNLPLPDLPTGVHAMSAHVMRVMEQDILSEHVTGPAMVHENPKQSAKYVRKLDTLPRNAVCSPQRSRVAILIQKTDNARDKRGIGLGLT